MYNYKGMKKLTIKEAKLAFNNKRMVYKLYDDNIEELVQDIKDFDDEELHDYDYGIEI